MKPVGDSLVIQILRFDEVIASVKKSNDSSLPENTTWTRHGRSAVMISIEENCDGNFVRFFWRLHIIM